MQKSPRPLRDGSVARALGVTRVARLTGLDRTGVEVASAVRPGGHVLQVTNGKGESFEEAAAGALLEAAELWASERPRAEAWDSPAALAAMCGPGAIVTPEALAPGGAGHGWARLRLAWRTGRDLRSGEEVLVPAHAVHCPPPGTALLGPAVVPWSSNGMGAHPHRAAALLHAVLEVAERHLLARALPDGFTPRALAARLLDPASLAATPRAAGLAARIARGGIRPYVVDASLAGVGLPCAAALLVDEGGPVPVAAGYACRLTPDAALSAALLEAAQSRATEIHGAREDVATGDRDAAEPIGPLLAAARPRRRAGALSTVRARTARHAVRAVLAQLARAGLRRAVAVDLEGPPGVHVVKVLAPGLVVSELL
jgi:ribosomal protein S12 methylthiotransferase accessory factor